MSIQQQRTYYFNSYLASFTAEVIDQQFRDGQWLISLNETAFYPTSGGQPHDTGFLGSYPVRDVYINDETNVVHVINQVPEDKKMPFQLGEQVTGQIDWARRFDYMQHHTGQHILSAAFEQELNLDTVSFHLGQEDVTIDIDVAALKWEDIEAVEAVANAVIEENLPVTAKFVTEDALPALKLRRSPKVKQDIRIVSIGQFDNNACGGTHVGSTSQVGLLKIVKAERTRQGVRIHFLCGHRASVDYRQRFLALRDTAASLSVGFDEVPKTVTRLLEEVKTLRKQEQEARSHFLELVAEQYVASSNTAKQGQQVFCAHVLELRTPAELQPFATSMLNKTEDFDDRVVALTYESGHRVHLCVVTSESSLIHAGDVVRKALLAIGGKGGGNKNAAQGAARLQEQGSGGSLLKIVEEMLLNF